ncbi:beta-ketoacyl synthase [Gillisia sp. M10.2A]|uniref:Beta-ketoacyl synthase n=1 Tax=Gillisia lutea TaxID=2909668 RepID=A0ABS9EIL9_9FLAO|nr:beta-ketoacyl synthase N-terminal-like domain-containing protein [Gillisia lutea]MCF4101640.1 beta-ketoacyl synthase [Gillisia lutea]
MKKTYLLEDAIISPLGFTTEENIEAIIQLRSALRFHENKRFPSQGYYAGIIDADHLNSVFSEMASPNNFTKLEQMMLLAVKQVLDKNLQLDLSKTALIISTTKGNINLLNEASNFPKERVLLHHLANIIKDFFGFGMKPMVISNACISGGLAVAVAKRFIGLGNFEHAIVVAGDLVSEFVVSGFQSFQAISNAPCKPFSMNRKGISLGEAAGAVLVSSKSDKDPGNIQILSEASANDANHISGPSRTGEGLFLSIQQALKEANVHAGQIDYLSAHGTATSFNDEMEAIAFGRANLLDSPVNSFKGYYGHTLGASALIETILTKHSLLNNELYMSLNFDELGVSQKINIIKQFEKRPLNLALKTASGFGGCNLAMLLKKEDHE